MSESSHHASGSDDQLSFEKTFNIRFNSSDLSISPDLPRLKLQFVNGGWQGGIHQLKDDGQGGKVEEIIEFKDFSPSDDQAATALKCIIERQTFLLELHEDNLRDVASFVVAKRILGNDPGPVDETDIWVAEEEGPKDDPPLP